MKTGLTIEQLAAEILRQKEAKEDYIVNTGRLRMEPSGNDVLLRVLDSDSVDRIEPLDIGSTAHRQIGTHLSIPAKYYEKMQTENPELLAQNVNAWFAKEPKDRMLRFSVIDICGWIITKLHPRSCRFFQKCRASVSKAVKSPRTACISKW